MPITPELSPFFESSEMMWLALERLRALYLHRERYPNSPLPTRSRPHSGRFPHRPHPRRAAPSPARTLTVDDLDMFDLEVLISRQLERNALRMRRSEIDAEYVARKGLERFQNQARRRSLDQPEGEGWASEGDPLEEMSEQIRKIEIEKTLYANQMNGHGYLWYHTRLVLLDLPRRPHQPIDTELEGEGALPLQIPTDAQARPHADHDRYGSEMFQQRLYADLYAHLKRLNFFEELKASKSSKAQDRVNVIQRWQERLEELTRPLEPRERVWGKITLERPDVVTGAHTPVACTAEVNEASLDYTRLLTRPQEGSQESKKGALAKRWSRTREDMTEALIKLIEARAATLNDEERCELMRLMLDQPLSPRRAKQKERPSEDILRAINALEARAHTQLCSLNHHPEHCRFIDIQISDSSARWLTLYAARSLFEIMSRDREVKCPQGTAARVEGAEEIL